MYNTYFHTPYYKPIYNYNDNRTPNMLVSVENGTSWIKKYCCSIIQIGSFFFLLETET